MTTSRYTYVLTNADARKVEALLSDRQTMTFAALQVLPAAYDHSKIEDIRFLDGDLSEGSRVSFVAPDPKTTSRKTVKPNPFRHSLDVVSVSVSPDFPSNNLLAMNEAGHAFISKHVEAHVCNAIEKLAQHATPDEFRDLSVTTATLITVTYLKGLVVIAYHFWKLKNDSNTINRLWEILDHLDDHLSEPMAQLPEGEAG